MYRIYSSVLLFIVSGLLVQVGVFGQLVVGTKDAGYSITTGDGIEVTQQSIHSANTIQDIDAGYPASWISDYIAVEMKVRDHGMEEVHVGDDDHFTMAQKDVLTKLGVGAKITLVIKYMPEDEAAVRVINKAYIISPEVAAQFDGGQAALDTYIDAQIYTKLVSSAISKRSTITFTISDRGEVLAVQVKKSSGNDHIDQLMIEAIRNMPQWIPARDIDGHPVVQELQLNIGSAMGIGC